MFVEHACSVPHKHLPKGVNVIIWKWKCPLCKQRWEVTSRWNSSRAERIGLRRSLPKRRWAQVE